MRRASRDLAAVEPDRAAPRPGQAEDRAQHGGLAGAVGAEQRKYLSASTASEAPNSAWVSP